MSVAEPRVEERPSTLPEAIARAAAAPAAGIRFVDRRERETWVPWSALEERALAVCGGLRALGVAPGERVALVFSTSPAFVEALFGALLAGAVPTALHPPPRFGRLDDYGQRLGAMLAAIDARLVLADRRGARRLGSGPAAARPLGCRTLAELPPVDAGAAEVVLTGPDDVAMVQFSSGTTVAPKPVALSHRAVLSQARMLNDLWPDTAEVRHTGLSWLPLYHDMGLIGCVLPALERPGEMTLVPPEVFAARPAIWLRAISRFGASVSPGTNFAYAYCVDRIEDDELEGVDLSCWRVALNGAEPVTAEVMRRFADRFSRWGFRPQALTPVYGLAEAALAVTFSAVAEPFVCERFDRRGLGEGRAVAAVGGREITSVGRPVAGFELSIRDAAGRPLAEGAVGRIWARGPSLMEGYLGRPRATGRVLRDGWLDTGDLGFLHRGELYVTGRAKDLIIVRGRNHSPEEIELAVARLDAVQTGGVAAVSHQPEGADREQVLLFVERRRKLRDGEPHRLAETCREQVRAAVGIDVDRVVVLRPDSLPRTSSGKIRRGETLGRYLAAELRVEVELGSMG